MKLKITRQFWIVTLAAILIVSGLAFSVRNSAMTQAHNFYFLKWIGERIDLHVLTIAAPDKQVKHLELSQKRLDEFVLLQATGAKECCKLRTLNDYKKRLASGFFMAEQLALIDPKFTPELVDVYNVSLDQLKQMQDWGESAIETDFVATAKYYNSQAIKTLLQRHQYSEQDTEFYKNLIEQYYDFVARDEAGLSTEQKAVLNQARGILDEGVELEWAYDLLVSI